ncbi:LamG-like jellyroll fold domain-containing protein [Saccharicrinis sp. FJH54]|uniref:LamG-like jellyroll fold domain-containing protein n=1 Tax=Saccharicrinis sp. FJH54 TaxID=3344665 RepID=UPI0035D46ECD
MKQYVYTLKFLRSLSLAVAFMLGNYMFAQTLEDGLKVHYTFESAADGVVPDASGNSNDGILNNDATVGVSEDGRNVLVLNQDSGYVEIDPAYGSDFSSYSDFTVATWVYLDEQGYNARLLDIGTGRYNNAAFTPWFYGNQVCQLKIRNEDIPDADVIAANSAVPVNEWTHVVFTLQGTTGTIYMNGVAVGENTSVTVNPSTMGIDVANFTAWIGKSQWVGNGDSFLKGELSDFRIYNRALSQSEILNLAGLPEELTTAFDNLSPEGLDEVTSNLTLPETDGNVSIKWSSSDTTIIDSVGNVTRPEKFDITVILTATLTMESNGKTYTMTRKFDAYVLALTQAEDLVAQWDFAEEDIDFSNPDAITVSDVSENGFTGTLYNDAKIRTIGNTNQYNVLDLGNGTGYFDMGTDIGKDIYQLGDYTISAYYLVEEENTDIGSNGNFIWCISNTDDIDADRNGAMIERLTDHRFSITPTIYGGDQQSVNPGVNPASTDGWKGVWHHVLYVQNGSVGTVYIDGDVAATGTVTNLPSTSLKKAGMEGTLFNWIGRSCYTADVYLKNTLVYDFRLYGKALSEGEIQLSSPFGIGLDVYSVLDELNAAYAENKDASYPAELDAEYDNLDLGDLSNLTTDLTLPSQGELDNSISITWSSAPGLISPEGVVTRPDYLDTDVKLTAVLSKRGYKLTKEFTATIPANAATKYTSDLLIHFNFDDENVNGSTVTDLSEQHFEGTMMHGADNRILSDGSTGYGVLNLMGDSSYFDMGDEVGKVIYALKDGFSISLYYLIETAKTNLSDNGNFLYTFSNSDSSAAYRNGYMFGRASYNTYAISPYRWDNGQVGTAGGDLVTSAEWHHYVYVQDDTLGYIYQDGVAIDTATIKQFPNTTIPKAGMTGTTANFLGRSNFEGDSYLAQAMLYDFQLFNKKLTPADIDAMNNVTEDLYTAYLISLPVKDVKVEETYRVDTSIPGSIRIYDLKGDESVSVYNLTGRKVTVKNVQNIPVDRGIYIVKVNDSVKKVLVK